MPATIPPWLRDPIERFATRLERTLPERALVDRLASRPAVSVIIPIFDAPDAVARCLRSIRESGTPETTELVLVDDHSSHPSIDLVCRAFAEQWPRTKRLRNERNLGFVGTVNRGMREAAAGNDVLLLNSDTIVTPGWLPRLSIAAHLDDATATVCPLSNAAGVFSIPRAHDDRELPDGIDATGAQRVLSFVSDRELTEVPSTSGFCLLIKRAALERVGYFDSSLFLRGYGEENDWNERAAAAGFVHRVDDSRFVHHARGLSFGSAREQLKRRNSRILQSLHPGHADRLRAWERADPLRAVRERYGAVLESRDPQRAALLDVPVTVAIGSDPPRGEWSERARRISVAYGHGGALEIDLFGIARARRGAADLDASTFELMRRWEPWRVDLREPPLAQRVRSIAELFGAIVSFDAR